MTNRLLAMVKPFALSLFAVAFIAMAQGEVRADPVTFSTAGCFGAGCTPSATDTETFGTASLSACSSAKPLRPEILIEMRWLGPVVSPPTPAGSPWYVMGEC